MQTYDRKWLIAYLILISLFLLRYIPLIFPNIRLWGFNHLLFLPDYAAYIFGAIAVIGLLLPFVSSGRFLSEAASRCIYNTIFDNHKKNRNRFILIAIFGLIFILFKTPTHFLGDGYAILNNIASDTGKFYKWSEQGITILITSIQSLLGGESQTNARLSFLITAVTSGLIALWYYFKIADILLQNRDRQILILTGLFGSGTLLLFFGYVENYPLLIPALSGFIYYSLSFLKNGRGLTQAILFLIIGFLVHLQMAVFFPAVLIQLLLSPTGQRLYRKFKLLIISTATIALILILFLFIKKFTTDLYFENMFLPIIEGKVVSPGYTIFSLKHIADLFNQMNLLSPLILLWLVLAGKKLRQSISGPANIFLLTCSLCSLLFLLVIDPKLGMPRDWDLFCLTGIPLTLLTINCISDKRISQIKLFIPVLTILTALLTLPFLLTNLNPVSSESYIRYISNLGSKGRYSSLIVMRDYYEIINRSALVDSLNNVMSAEFLEKHYIDEATIFASNGNIQEARKYLGKITPDKFNSGYHNLLAVIYLKEGNHYIARKEFLKALQLQPYNPGLINNLAALYAETGLPDSALNILRRGLKFKADHVGLLESAGMTFLNMNNYDSASYYAEQLGRIDSAKYRSYAIMAKVYLMQNNLKMGEQYSRLYLEQGRHDPYFKLKSEYFLYHINRLKSSQ